MNVNKKPHELINGLFRLLFDGKKGRSNNVVRRHVRLTYYIKGWANRNLVDLLIEQWVECANKYDVHLSRK